MAGITIDQVTAAYVKSREEIRSLEAQIDKIKEVQGKRETYLLQTLEKDGLQNVKTEHGTVYKSLKESVTVADWDAVLGWVKENEAWEYLTIGVGKKAVLDLMGEDRSTPPLPGVNYTAVRTVGIRKS